MEVVRVYIPVLIPELKEKSIQFPTIDYDVRRGFFMDDFYQFEEVPSTPSLSLITKSVGFLKAFLFFSFVSIKITM